MSLLPGGANVLLLYGQKMRMRFFESENLGMPVPFLRRIRRSTRRT